MILTPDPLRLLFIASDKMHSIELQRKARTYADLKCNELIIDSSESGDAITRLKFLEKSEDLLPSAAIFCVSEIQPILDFIHYTELRHYAIPVYFLSPAHLENEIKEPIPFNNLLSEKAVVELSRFDIEDGFFLNQIINSVRWTAYLMKRVKRENFASISMGARFYSHEIRNPLTNIDISSAELKSERETQKSKPSAFIHFIEKNSRRINELLGSILQNTRTDDILIERIYLEALIDSVISSCVARFPDHSFKMIGSTDYHIFGDEEKLGAALYHVLVNAAEASQASTGIIEIRIVKELEMIKITINDNGSGISAEDRAFICDPFFTKKIKSAGLGLSAALDIVHRHNGKITFGSNPTGGASITIILPDQSC